MSNRLEPSGLEAHLGFWLRFVSNHVTRSFQRRVEALGVSLSEWVALRSLYGAGSVGPSDLTAALGMTKGAVSKIVSRLQQKGLVERRDVQHDGRAQTIELTALGRRLVPRLARAADENDEAFFGHLPRSQRAELAKTLMEMTRFHQLRDLPVD